MIILLAFPLKKQKKAEQWTYIAVEKVDLCSNEGSKYYTTTAGKKLSFLLCDNDNKGILEMSTETVQQLKKKNPEPIT